MVSIVDANTAEQDMGCYCWLPFGLWPKMNYDSHSIGNVVDFFGNTQLIATNLITKVW